LVKRCLLAGSPENGMVLDPYAGGGTTVQIVLKLSRNVIEIELIP
jgi:DNA modification methylase